MHSQQPPGVVQNWSTLQCSKHDIEQCGYDHALVTRGRMRTQFPLPHGRPHAGEAEASSPVTARHALSTAKRREGQLRLSRGALTHGKGATAMKSLWVKGGRVPLPVPLSGIHRARPSQNRVLC